MRFFSIASIILLGSCSDVTPQSSSVTSSESSKVIYCVTHYAEKYSSDYEGARVVVSYSDESAALVVLHPSGAQSSMRFEKQSDGKYLDEILELDVSDTKSRISYRNPVFSDWYKATRCE